MRKLTKIDQLTRELLKGISERMNSSDYNSFNKVVQFDEDPVIAAQTNPAKNKPWGV